MNDLSPRGTSHISIQKKRDVNLKSHHVKNYKDIFVPLKVTFLFYTDSDLAGNTEKYWSEETTIQK